MKTSLNELIEIDRYIDNQMSVTQRSLFESRRETDGELNTTVVVQQQVRRLVTLHGRSKLRRSLEQIHYQYFNEPTHMVFREKIFSFFK